MKWQMTRPKLFRDGLRHVSWQVALNLSGLPAGFGIALLCFLAHSEAPLIYQLMEDRRQWNRVVVYSMSLTEAFLLAFGVLGYGFFGSSVSQSIADNIGRDLHLQLLPNALSALLGAATILGLSSKQLEPRQPRTASDSSRFA